ncbi:uncharacterized protein BT62DRAFT_919186 [Guyanagaster necrorhizus]|uniref:DDE-1 domain-containing protein n=1 Tax=Guyanagaster necrorhizus TaxID=856835 RepID=A0A9P7VTR7_9AGAR|nr:uncharacterized protein BT62DRAFT_919186 [Guyanagaster necrorhizus MCA 3950]KAG7447253.1 hypothetical protein BT62DRAFT_919186 [Guyanagaster necrorhizus MCA 3950]
MSDICIHNQCHVSDDLTNIHVVNFTPNLTAHVQLDDTDIIQYFKAYYQCYFMQCAIDCYDTGVSPAQIYDINQLKAMQLADLAWHEVDASIIHNCWCKAGILSDLFLNPTASTSTPVVSVLSLLNTGDSDTYLAAAEKEVTDSLSHLQRIGVLQSQNMMAIDELIDFALEDSDEDIFNAIKECQNAEQEKEMNGGGDGGDDDATDKKPSWKEALTAASALWRYVADVDEPFACKLETVLTNFGHQTHLEEFHSMELTTITDYFPYQLLPYL